MDQTEFKKLRQALGYTQQALAAYWGINARTIRKWESGERPVNPIAAWGIKTMFKLGMKATK